MFGIKETLFLGGSQNLSHFTYAFYVYEVPDSIDGLFFESHQHPPPFECQPRAELSLNMSRQQTHCLPLDSSVKRYLPFIESVIPSDQLLLFAHKCLGFNWKFCILEDPSVLGKQRQLVTPSSVAICWPSAPSLAVQKSAIISFRWCPFWHISGIFLLFQKSQLA